MTKFYLPDGDFLNLSTFSDLPTYICACQLTAANIQYHWIGNYYQTISNLHMVCYSSLLRWEQHVERANFDQEKIRHPPNPTTPSSFVNYISPLCLNSCISYQFVCTYDYYFISMNLNFVYFDLIFQGVNKTRSVSFINTLYQYDFPWSNLRERGIERTYLKEK